MSLDLTQDDLLYFIIHNILPNTSHQIIHVLYVMQTDETNTHWLFCLDQMPQIGTIVMLACRTFAIGINRHAKHAGILLISQYYLTLFT